MQSKKKWEHGPGCDVSLRRSSWSISVWALSLCTCFSTVILLSHGSPVAWQCLDVCKEIVNQSCFSWCLKGMSNRRKKWELCVGKFRKKSNRKEELIDLCVCFSICLCFSLSFCNCLWFYLILFFFVLLFFLACFVFYSIIWMTVVVFICLNVFLYITSHPQTHTHTHTDWCALQSRHSLWRVTSPYWGYKEKSSKPKTSAF